MVPVERTAGVVLAGGVGSRMRSGGAHSSDKGLQALRGEPLVAHVARRLRPQVGSLIISANLHRDDYAAFGDRVVADVDDARRGPLAGIQAALRACGTPYLAVVPCDAPFVPADLVATLGAALDDAAVDVAFAATPVRSHPVFCLMRARVAAGLDGYLDGGGRAVRGWLATVSSRAVSFADESAFRNLNTQDDLRDAADG